MEKARYFRERIDAGEVLVGASISLSDPIVSEILAGVSDFLWIDAEHNPLSPEVVQGHLLATAGSRCPAIVRVPTGDTNVVKIVLDAGADGVIGPQVRSAEEARRFVEACRYPPLGRRGFGPRRPGRYGDRTGADFVAEANAQVLAFVMIEDVGALEELDAILAIDGLDGVCLGPSDLSGSLGHLGEVGHPDVQRAIDLVAGKTRRKGKYLGVGMGTDVAAGRAWIERGVQWIQFGVDYMYLRERMRELHTAMHAGRPRDAG
jgi:2-keto-3-deoxy-L-rhamnonate aldolase RhmA